MSLSRPSPAEAPAQCGPHEFCRVLGGAGHLPTGLQGRARIPELTPDGDRNLVSVECVIRAPCGSRPASAPLKMEHLAFVPGAWAKPPGCRPRCPARHSASSSPFSPASLSGHPPPRSPLSALPLLAVRQASGRAFLGQQEFVL